MLRLRILLSYWYYRTADLDTLLARAFSVPYPEIFADSGAFSAMTQGARVSVKEYAEWLLRYRHWFSVYANLDVIRHAELTWANQQTLEDRYGLEPLPVFHVAESWDWLAHYLARYRYLALGVAGHPASHYMGWLVRAFRENGARCAYHGFGITTWAALRSFPWYSVDSSTWGQGFRYGVIPLFDHKRGGFLKLALGDRAAWLRNAPLVRSYGYDPRDFGERARNTRAKNAGLGALSYLRAEQWLRSYWGEQYIPAPAGCAAGAGVKLYLADSAGGMNGPAAAQQAVRAQEATQAAGWGSAGCKVYLADTNTQNLRLAEGGLKMYLADVRSALTDSAAAHTAVSHAPAL